MHFIAKALTGSGVGDKTAELISKVVSGLTTTGVAAAVGGAQGAAASGSANFNNRQLHPSEHQLDLTLAAKSNGKYTVAQIEDALHATGNTETGENIIAGMLVNPSERNAIYGTGAVLVAMVNWLR